MWATADLTSSCVLTLGTDGNRPCYTLAARGSFLLWNSFLWDVWFLGNLNRNICVSGFQFDLKTSFTILNNDNYFYHHTYYDTVVYCQLWMNSNRCFLFFSLYRAELNLACRKLLQIDYHKGSQHSHQHSRWKKDTSGWHGQPLVSVPLLSEHYWADSIRNQFWTCALLQGARQTWMEYSPVCSIYHTLSLSLPPSLPPPPHVFTPLFVLQKINSKLFMMLLNNNGQVCL